MITIDVRNISAQEWTSKSAFFLAPYGNPPKLTDETEWRSWARTVTNFPTVAGLLPPRPEGFDDWREWAVRFNQVAQLLTT